MKGRRKAAMLALTVSVAVLAVLCIFPMLFRPLWFDEALTLIEYIRLDGLADIYFFYTIPNNHIAYNIILKCWLMIFPVSEPCLRGLSALLALASLLVMFLIMRRRFGIAVSSGLLLCFVLSMPFCIYGTAVRGYMLSFLLVSLALFFSLEFARFRRARDYAGYLLCALLCVGTIPSNMAALICILPAVFLDSGKVPPKRMLRPALLLVAGAFFALAIFYLPILGKFLKAMSLREGWSSAGGAALHFYGAFAVCFLPAILFAAASFPDAARRRRIFLLSAAGLLLPGLFFLIRTPSPFPRSLFPCWPVMIFIVGHLCHRGAALARTSLGPQMRRLLYMGLLMLAMLTGYVERQYNVEIGRLLTRSGQDDFFNPYFIENHNPMRVAVKLRELGAAARDGVFIDKCVDYPSFIFYVAATGFPQELVFFDHPYREIGSVGDSEGLFVVTSGDERMNSLIRRFGFSGYELREECSGVRIYHAKR